MLKEVLCVLLENPRLGHYVRDIRYSLRPGILIRTQSFHDESINSIRDAFKQSSATAGLHWSSDVWRQETSVWDTDSLLWLLLTMLPDLKTLTLGSAGITKISTNIRQAAAATPPYLCKLRAITIRRCRIVS